AAMKEKNDKVADDLNQQEIETSKSEQISNKRKDDKSEIDSLLNKHDSHDNIAKKRRCDSMVDDDFSDFADKESKQHKLHKVSKTEQQQDDLNDPMDINSNEKNQSQMSMHSDQQSA